MLNENCTVYTGQQINFTNKFTPVIIESGLSVFCPIIIECYPG